MLTETTGRTPQDLATELAVLRDADWASVWAGPPMPEPELREWCGRYGWEPLTFDRQLVVRGRSGGELTLSSNGQWSPVSSVRYDAWDVRAGEAADNGTVLSSADEAWPGYLDAAVSALGAPVWAGSWDAEDFPEPPTPAFWRGRESRLSKRSPYRLAYWAPRSADGAAFVLDQSVSFPTWTQDLPGGSMICLTARAAAEVVRTG
ncbi:hypothetical protein BFF78_20180 [Streptomyces fodineus]|uniref:Uncharacterized protein n=1 Tax=Streptomyces fodineus TaxID=1904616 RepID=A0A1D7YBY6_9ACTN|nr:hypothetical protein [Streptomyces fodineus]AOR33072.1 hypothetical protein BFF78_20180 [Streptomyces fodineus]